MLSYFRSLASRFLNRSHIENDMDEELRSHMEHRADDLERSGLTRTEAERRARIEFGGHARFQEECREELGGNFLETVIQDVRFSSRVLRKSPGFLIAAVVTLALAIGANAVVFGVLNTLVLRPLNVPGAQSLYGIDYGESGFQSYPDYVDERDRNRTFTSLAAFSITAVGLDTGQSPAPAWVYETSGNYFEALGIRPYLGRFFRSSDEHGPNSAPYIVLTYGYWHTHFQDDGSVVGRVVRVNKHPFTILGIAPPEFHGTLLFFAPDLFVPIVNHEQVEGINNLNTRANRWVFEVLGHLKPGVTPAQAAADLNSIGAYLERTYPKDHGRVLYSLSRPSLYGNFLGGPVRAFIAGLMLLAGLILLAACTNLGNLFAARAADRSRDIALRLALGASNSRILRQLFTEAILVSLIGGALGLVASVALLDRLSVWQPFARFPMHVPVTPDGNVYMVALGLALLSGFLFGIVPVRQVLRTDPYQVVKAGSTGGSGRRLSVRDLLLVVQIAICGVLVTSSMVAVRGLARTLNNNFGFEPRHAMLVNTDLNMAGYHGDQVPEMQKRIIERMVTIPGVESVGLIDQPPLAMNGTTTTVFTDEAIDLRPANAAAFPYLYYISPEYFQAAGTPMAAGRSVTWHDDKNAPPVAVVNREFARRVFGSASGAMGKYFKRRSGVRVLVVGVVEDGKYLNLTEGQKPAIFVPILASATPVTWFVVRSANNPQQMAGAVRNTLRNLDPALPAYIQTWTKELDGVLFPARVATVALGVLGIMGAMLSVTGIFGLAAYSVSKRLRELGIRMALGAQRREVLQTALGRAFKLLALGSAAGLLLGVLATRVLAAIVYQATPRDPLVLAGVVLAMLFLGLLATWIPAQRALAADPLALLREQ